MKIAKVSKTKDDMGKGKWWCNWYKCTRCGENDIALGFKYCPDCGVKIEWVE